MYFHGARFSNYEAWLSDPTHIKPSAQVVWPIVGQEILNGDVGGGFQGIQITSGFFQLWRGSGITSELQLYSTAIGGLVMAAAMFFAGWFHYHKAAPKLEWFQNVESMLNHHLAGLLGLGSLGWAGHQIHISLPINKLLDAGVDPKEIPLPHDLMFNRAFMADLYPSFSKGLAPFFTLNWSEYSDFLTFKGGLNPVTGGLWLSDTAHHHVAIAVLFLVAGHMYRTNWGIGHSIKEILEAHRGPFTGAGHVGLYEILTTSWHAQLAINLALFGSLSIIVAFLEWVTLNSTICWNSSMRSIFLNLHNFFFCSLKQQQEGISKITYPGVLNDFFIYGTILQVEPISREPFAKQKQVFSFVLDFFKQKFLIPLLCGVSMGSSETTRGGLSFYHQLLSTNPTSPVCIATPTESTFGCSASLTEGLRVKKKRFSCVAPIIGPDKKSLEKKIFDFSAYSLIKPQHKRSINSSFLEWFIGFTEGDGSFSIKNNRPVFIINQADLPLMYSIKSTLGFGSVTRFQQDGTTYGCFSVHNVKGIERLIAIFNGNIFLEKGQVRFTRWVQIFNLLKQKSSLVDKIPIVIKKRLNSNQLSLQTSWLAGFFDAEGCLSASLLKSARHTSGMRLCLKACIDQKSEFILMLQIAKLFKVSNLTTRSLSKEYYRVEASSKTQLPLICHYFKNHPLRGQKHLVFVKWQRLVILFCKSQHLETSTVLLQKKILAVQGLNQEFKKHKNRARCLQEQLDQEAAQSKIES